jgi:DNA mismatch repair protein MutS2
VVEELLPPAPEGLGAVDFTRITPGDRVEVAGRRELAEVLLVEPDRRRLTVQLGGTLKATLGPEKILRHLPASSGRASSPPTAQVKINAPAPSGRLADHGALGASGGALPVLNLVGKRVEEAERLLLPFLDQALLGGHERVEIIHGHGTGRLRRGLHEILAALPYVSRFHHPESPAGGAAVTIVELQRGA